MSVSLSNVGLVLVPLHAAADNCYVQLPHCFRCEVNVAGPQDYDFENTSPYGTDEQTYASAFNTWQIEQVRILSIFTTSKYYGLQNIAPFALSSCRWKRHAAKAVNRCCRAASLLLTACMQTGLAILRESSILWMEPS